MKSFVTKILIICIVSVLSLQSTIVFADENFYSANDILFYNSDSSDVCATTSVGPIPGEDNLKKIYNYFLGKGTSQKVAAAIVGNIYQESKGDPLLRQSKGRHDNPATVGVYKNGSLFENKSGQSSVGDAWGLIQWDPGNAVLYWQKQAGVQGDPRALETQLEITWWHLNNLAPTSKKNVLAKMEAASDVNEATAIMVKDFFGAGKPMLENRQRAAAKALSYPIDQTILASIKSSTSDVGCPPVDSSLSEGGLNEEQAKRFVINYGKNTNGDSEKFAGSASWNRCNGGGSNCVTFSQFFFNKFSKGSKDFAMPNGEGVVRYLRSKGVATGSTPRVGAIFSWKGGTYGHTGVVLGIKGDTIIVGHASCSSDGRGAGDGVSKNGSAFILTGKPNDPHVWYSKSIVPNEFAYPDVDLAAIEKYLATGE